MNKKTNSKNKWTKGSAILLSAAVLCCEAAALPAYAMSVIYDDIIADNEKAIEIDEYRKELSQGEEHIFDDSKIDEGTGSLTEAKAVEGVHETIWAEGVSIEDDEFYKMSEQNGFEAYVTGHGIGNGWYDLNKDFDSKDSTLCSGVVAANMLHWWKDRNEEYLDRYFAQSEENGTYIFNNEKHDFRELIKLYESENGYMEKSGLLDMIKKAFDGGWIWTDKVLDLYINGYYYNNESKKNTIRENGFKPSRFNFFNKVFGRNLLTDIVRISNRDSLSTVVKDSLEKGDILGLAYLNMNVGNTGHIVTLWGADFNKNGDIIAVYVTDSDDKDTIVNDMKIGIKRFRIYEDGNRVKVSGYKEEKTGAIILSIYSLSQGKEYWEEYFSKYNQDDDTSKKDDNTEADDNTESNENNTDNSSENNNESHKKDNTGSNGDIIDNSSEDNNNNTNNERQIDKTDDISENNLPKMKEENIQNNIKEEKGSNKIQDSGILNENTASIRSFTRGSGGGGSSSGGRGGIVSRGQRKAFQADKVSKNKGEWKRDLKGWWYQNSDNTWQKSSWLELEWNEKKDWYYFNAEGYMVVGWHNIGGKWYYFYPKTEANTYCGSMAKETNIDGYVIDKTGVAKR